MPKSNKFTLSEQDKETYKNIEIQHLYRNDKHADLPLLIVAKNNKKIIIPTFKKLMYCLAPEYFENSFDETRHDDGKIYEMKIPEMIDPYWMKRYIGFLHLFNFDEDAKTYKFPGKEISILEE